MGRNHVHFCAGLPEDGQVISGMRAESDIVVELDGPRALAAGLRFFRAENGVLLTPGDANGLVSKALFKRVLDRATGADLPFL